MIETIKSSSSIKELADQIQSRKKPKSIYDSISSFFKRLDSRVTSSNYSIGLAAAVTCTLAVVSLINMEETSDPDYIHHISLTLWLVSGLSAIFGFFGLLRGFFEDLRSISIPLLVTSQVSALMCIFLQSPNMLTALLLISGLISWFGIGVYTDKSQKAKGRRRSEDMEIISSWIKDQKEQISQDYAEQKKSLRSDLDWFGIKINEFTTHARNPRLGNDFKKKCIARKKAMIVEQEKHKSSLLALKEKERVVTEILQEVLNSIVPEFRTHLAFLEDLEEVDMRLQKSKKNLIKTQKLLKETDDKFIKIFITVTSVMDKAHATNKSLTEIMQKDPIESAGLIEGAISSFNSNELIEILNAVRAK